MMRLRMLDFQCSKCNKIFEKLIDLDTQEGDPLCPVCQLPSKAIIGNPKHSKHISWTTWRMDCS